MDDPSLHERDHIDTYTDWLPPRESQSTTPRQGGSRVVTQPSLTVRVGVHTDSKSEKSLSKVPREIEYSDSIQLGVGDYPELRFLGRRLIVLPKVKKGAEHFSLAVSPFDQTQTIVLIIAAIIITILLGLFVFFLLSRPSRRAFIETVAIAADRQQDKNSKLIEKYKDRIREDERGSKKGGATNINLRITGPVRGKYVVGYSKGSKAEKSRPYVVDYENE